MQWSHLGLSALRDVFNWHPLFVHLPLAFLPGAWLFYAWAVLFNRRQALAVGRACLLLGTVGAWAALLTGLRAEDTIPHDETVHALMQTHKFVAIITALVFTALGAWTWKRVNGWLWRPRMFLGALTLALGLVVQTGDLGARLVYLHGAGIRTGPGTGQTTPHAEELALPHAHEHEHDHAGHPE